MSGQVVVLGPGEGRRIDLGGFGMLVKAGAEETGGAYSLLESDEPPGFGPPLHVHHDCAETFWVVRGSYDVVVGNERWACPAGSFVHVPAGLVHGFRVGPEPSSKLNLYTPAAMVGYFDDLGAAIRDGLDDGAVARIADQHAMQVLGPVPEGYA